jgi:pyruvate ferredoxin oxidoreductase alpha subunit
LSRITGNKYPHFDTYRMQGAEAVIVTMSSAAGTTKAVVDKMRKDGKPVGLLKLRLFRPFPYAKVAAALKGIKTVGVLDRSFSFGAYAPLCTEIRNSLYDLTKKPRLQSYVFGLGGRDLLESHVEHAFNELLSGKVTKEEKYLGLR